MNSRLLIVGRERQREVEDLRRQEYARASGFAVDLTTLGWKSSDDESFILVAEEDGEVISTMRGEFIDDLAMLERKLECPWDFPMDLNLPVLLLSRAATTSQSRAKGLNLVLRYWFLRFAIARGAGAVVGTFVSGSPREATLKKMGYQFFENKLGWQQSTYRSLRPVQVVALDLATTAEQALSYCLEIAGESISRFKFENDFPELRFVRSL